MGADVLAKNSAILRSLTTFKGLVNVNRRNIAVWVKRRFGYFTNYTVDDLKTEALGYQRRTAVK